MCLVTDHRHAGLNYVNASGISARGGDFVPLHFVAYGSKVELSKGLCSISLAIPELQIQSSKVELSNGLCSISLAIPELETQSSKLELSNGLCSISLAIPELEIQSSKVELSNDLSSYPKIIGQASNVIGFQLRVVYSTHTQ